MQSGEAQSTKTFVLSRRMMIPAAAAILAWMEQTFVLIHAALVGGLESGRTSVVGDGFYVHEIIITIT